MTSTPSCGKCGQLMRQEGRYADWHCECCDRSVSCPHVGTMTRIFRRLMGRRV